MGKAPPLVMLAALLIALSACGNRGLSSTTHIATVTPKQHHHHAPPSPKQAALEKTTKCLQGIPFLKVDTSGATLADIQVRADMDTGGGNAFIAVFSSHAEAVKYSRSGGGSGAVGNLAGAIYYFEGSQNFQSAVEGCLA